MEIRMSRDGNLLSRFRREKSEDIYPRRREVEGYEIVFVGRINLTTKENR